MQYFVYGNDNQIYGHIDLVTLQTWAAQGHITPGTLIANEQQGERFPASSILPPHAFRPTRIACPNCGTLVEHNMRICPNCGVLTPTVWPPQPNGLPGYRVSTTRNESGVPRGLFLGCFISLFLFFGSIALISVIASFASSSFQNTVIVGIYFGGGTAIYFGFRRRYPKITLGILIMMLVCAALVVGTVMICPPVVL